MTATGRDDHCGCKIGRNAKKYVLEELDEDLIRERHDREASLRDLASFVNTRILEAAINEADADIAGDPASVYSALTDDDVRPARRVAVTDQLTNVGVEVADLTADFVSYQSVRHHFQTCLDMDTNRRGIETVQEGREVLEQARQRAENVIDRTLARLRRTGSLSTGDLTVIATVTITCEDCGNVYRVDELLDHGRCGCGELDE